jgi:hypothetical protein
MINNIVAIMIALGYIAGAIGFWKVRKAYPSVQSFGYVLYFVFGLWAAFYVVEVIYGLEALGFLVWLSRTAHLGQLLIIAMAVVLGRRVTRGR